MQAFSRILILGAVICLFIALVIKMSTLGKILPGPYPINWARLADTILLFAIAIGVTSKK